MTSNKRSATIKLNKQKRHQQNSHQKEQQNADDYLSLLMEQSGVNDYFVSLLDPMSRINLCFCSKKFKRLLFTHIKKFLEDGCAKLLKPNPRKNTTQLLIDRPYLKDFISKFKEGPVYYQYECLFMMFNHEELETLKRYPIYRNDPKKNTVAIMGYKMSTPFHLTKTESLDDTKIDSRPRVIVNPETNNISMIPSWLCEEEDTMIRANDDTILAYTQDDSALLYYQENKLIHVGSIVKEKRTDREFFIDYPLPYRAYNETSVPFLQHIGSPDSTHIKYARKLLNIPNGPVRLDLMPGSTLYEKMKKMEKPDSEHNVAFKDAITVYVVYTPRNLLKTHARCYRLVIFGANVFYEYFPHCYLRSIKEIHKVEKFKSNGISIQDC